MKRVLVTGSRGYLGAVLVPWLVQHGFAVVEVDAGWFEPWRTAAEVARPLVRVDIRDASWERFAGVDAIVHLAALSNDPLGAMDPALTHEINGHSSLRLARWARKAGVERFVFASTCSVYGAAGAEWVDEQSEARPLTAYAASKWAVEQGLLQLADEHFSPVILRFATVYGFSPSMRLDLVANNLAAWAVATGEVRLQSDGTAWRPLVHVRDAARAIVAALEAPRHMVAGQVFNVGSDRHNYTVRQIAETVAAVVPGARVAVAAGAGADARSYRVRFHKLASGLPDATPLEEFEGGIGELAERLQGLGVTRETLERGHFARLEQLRELQRSGALDGALRWRAEASLATRGLVPR